MTIPVNKPADKDSMARFDSVLNAYKSRAGADAEPPAELDARILAMAAQPARISFSNEAPSAPAARIRARRMPTWISWAAGAGALILSGGVLRLMLQESPNPQSVQIEAQVPAAPVEVLADTRERVQSEAAAALPKAAEAAIAKSLDAPENTLSPVMDLPPAPAEAVAELPSDSRSESPADFAANASAPSAETAEPNLAAADRAKELALAPPNADSADEALDELQITGSRIKSRAPQAFPEPMQDDSSDTLDAIVLAPSIALAPADDSESPVDTQPYAAKMAPPLGGALARTDAANAANKSTALSEPDADANEIDAPAPSTRRAAPAPQAMPQAITEKREEAKKSLDPESLKRAFAKLRKLQAAGNVQALKQAIKQFRRDFPQGTEIPTDLKAAFEATPNPPS